MPGTDNISKHMSFAVFMLSNFSWNERLFDFMRTCLQIDLVLLSRKIWTVMKHVCHVFGALLWFQACKLSMRRKMFMRKSWHRAKNLLAATMTSLTCSGVLLLAWCHYHAFLMACFCLELLSCNIYLGLWSHSYQFWRIMSAKILPVHHTQSGTPLSLVLRET